MPKRAKYGNKHTIIDGIEFHSRKESNRYLELKMMAKSGDIENLELQKKFALIPSQKLTTGKTERACAYIADFFYTVKGIPITEDVKGKRTDIYVIKRKLMKFIHNIEIKET